MARAKGKPVTLWRWMLIAALALAGLTVAKAWHDTMRDPVIHRLQVPFFPADNPQERRRIVLLADIHVAGPDMSPTRLAGIVTQVNALQPDMILIAGDFVSDKRTATRHYPAAEAIAPLAALDPDAKKWAVPGNHDHWRDMDAISRELSRYNIGLLRNQVVEVDGVTIAGLDDDFTGRADVPKVLGALEGRPGPVLFLSHSPDPFPQLPANTGIMLAGHTHCGQIGWPWGGSPATMSRYGARYACGVVRENGNLLLTSGGLGTSVLPFRLFTAPEIWVVDLMAGNPPD